MSLLRHRLAGLFRRTAAPLPEPVPPRKPVFRDHWRPSPDLEVSTVSSADTRVEPVVVLEGSDLPPELHSHLTPFQARHLAIRLLQAAEVCEDVTRTRGIHTGTRC